MAHSIIHTLFSWRARVGINAKTAFMDGPLQDPLRPPQTALALYPFGYCSLPLYCPDCRYSSRGTTLLPVPAVLPKYLDVLSIPMVRFCRNGAMIQSPSSVKIARFRSCAFRDLYRRSRSLETAPFARVQPVSKGWGSLRPGGRVNSLVPTFRSQTAALE